jgi:hypothetical protein
MHTPHIMIILTINTIDSLCFVCGRVECLPPFGVSGVLFVRMKPAADHVFSQSERFAQA